jgi:hypothetical protein
MKPIEIGNVELVAKADGRITLTIDPWHHATATWTVAGALEAIAWLQAWIHERETAMLMLPDDTQDAPDEDALAEGVGATGSLLGRHYRVTITYQIDCETQDEEQVLASVLPLLPSDRLLGMPRLVLTPVPPEEETP